MAYDYLGLVNDVNRRLNEVELTSANFASTTGYYSFAKDSVNSAIRHINQEEYGKLDWGTRQLLNFSKAVSEAANNYADSIGIDEDELSTDSNAAYRVKLAAGAALDAGGQLLNAFNGVVTFFRNDRYNPIDARETNLGKVTQAMMQIGTATQPEEYNAVIKDLRQQFEKAEGFGGTVEAIYEGFKQAPAEFLVEFVAKELAQEVPLVLASGGTGLIARGAAGAAQATTTLATKLGRTTAWGTNAGLQVLETAGATAAETYAELYAIFGYEGSSFEKGGYINRGFNDINWI